MSAVRRSARHRDAQGDVLNDTVETRRSCTPEQREDARPQPQSTPQKELRDKDANVNPHHAMSRLKGVLNEIVGILADPRNANTADDFIAVCEEGLRGIKKARVEARNALRRLTSNVLPLPRTAVADDQPLPPPTPTATEVQATSPPAPVAAVAADPNLMADSTLFRPKSFLAAVRGHNSVSPKKNKLTRLPTSTDKTTPPPPHETSKKAELERRLLNESVQESRDGAALRAEERQRNADERRKELQEDKLARLEASAEKAAQVKQRRDAAAEKIKQETATRVESASRRAEEHKERVKEKAARVSSRADEVLMVHDLSKENKALKLEIKLSEAEHTLEQRREEQRQLAKERSEAHSAVIGRQRDLSQQRVEKQQLREQQRVEALKRLDEQKLKDHEAKQLKAEEREKKIAQAAQAAQAEMEASRKKTEERISQSAQLREEQRVQQKQKLEKLDQKVKDARERRDKDEVLAKPTFYDVLAVAGAQDEEQSMAKLTRSLTATSRHSKTFVDAYQKENLITTKDVNKSRLRPIVTRLQSFAGTNLTQARQPLHDLSVLELTEVDHEYMRYYNGHEVLVKLAMDARKTHDHSTFKLCCDVLHRLLLDTVEGSAHARYFVRAGQLVPLVIVIYEEIKTLRKHNRSATLTAALSLVQICVSVIVNESQTSAKLAPVREQVMTDLDAAGVDKFCCAIASTCVDEEDLPSLQYALLLLQSHVSVLMKKKVDVHATTGWIRSAVTAIFTFLQNVLTPGGQPLKPQSVISPRSVSVMLTALRLLCSIARWRLDVLQEVLRGDRGAKEEGVSGSPESAAGAASNNGGELRNELFHIVNSFLSYACTRELERIPAAMGGHLDASAVDATLSKSFADAVNFGLTHSVLPRLPFADGPQLSARGTQTAFADFNYLRAALHELLLFVGYCALCDPSIQEIFSWGKEKPLLTHMLSSLPVQYFSLCKHALFPTLAAIIFGDDRNKLILQRVMDRTQLSRFLREEFELLPAKVKSLATQFAQECPGSATTVTPAAELAPAKPAAKKSWAEMDDDDDDVSFGPLAAVAAQAKPEPLSAPDPRQLEKERLVRVFRTAAALPAQQAALQFYRLDRRFPPALWLVAATFTEQDTTESSN